jgi:hypothetical protein
MIDFVKIQRGQDDGGDDKRGAMHEWRSRKSGDDDKIS